MTAPKKHNDRRTISPDALEKLRQTIIRLFSAGTFNDIGVRDICKEAKVSPQTVYKYFGNKESLLFACIREDMDVLYQSVSHAASSGGSVIERAERCARAFFGFYESNQAVARIIFLNIPPVNWVGNEEFTQTILMDSLGNLLTEAQATGLLSNQPVQLLLDMIAGAAHRVILRWLTEENSNLSEMTDSFLIILKQNLLSLGQTTYEARSTATT
ncbi:TetR/AcrR family transcriptional regulator [Parendozoicomonas sp. Alg238-R29]|uniref:TetR/AcrR family transcriptional regulator n=1 Tax=Parendozoicomonas sp. Alg238-R29 TaxID=2993446 RepID=UPI00248F145F|nr:TetR/AcrR family transcriptional regulator [Parendozoicomonas sp. Alg238-R29]